MSALVLGGSLNGLREVRLYGPLRARFGRSHWLAVESPAEAVHALCTLFKGFREALLGHTGPGYRVLVGEGARTDARDAEGLTLTAGSQQLIRIAPVLHGRKSGGVLSIVLGAAVLILAPYAAAAMFSAFGGVAGGAVAAAAANMTLAAGVAIGKSLILGGVIQLLSPQRNGSGSSADKETSYTFNGAANVNAPGGPVPLVIGRMVVGSVTVSAGISTDEYTPPGGTDPDLPDMPDGDFRNPRDPYYEVTA